MDILVGILPDNINIGAALLPSEKEQQVGLPKLGIYTRVVIPTDEPGGPVSITVRRPDGTSFKVSDGFTAERVEEARADAKKLGAPIFGLIVRGVSAPFLIPKPGRFVATVQMGDREIISGNLNVELTLPIASGQPPSQSPPAVS